MSMHTVKQLARLSGVSVRTLHYYDQIGLLRPAQVGANGYRYYGREELLRLQQILLHRELGLPLEAIATLLDDSDRGRVDRLREHRQQLMQRTEHYRELIATVDRTIAELEGGPEGGYEAALQRVFARETGRVRGPAGGAVRRTDARIASKRRVVTWQELGADGIAARMKELAED